MAGSQNPSIVNVWRPLQLDVQGPDLPEIDTSTVTAVYPLDPGWYALDQGLFHSPAIPINGVVGNYDPSGGLGVNFGNAIDLNNWRVVDSVLILLQGAAVNPVDFAVGVFQGVNDWYFNAAPVANPSCHQFLGPMLCPPGLPFRVENTIVGGVGDTWQCWITVRQAAPGVRIPAL